MKFHAVKEILIICFLLLFSSFLLFWKLGDTKLTHWDEAWYADISRTMAKTGEIFTPMWNGETFFHTSPLYIWLSAITMKIVGISEFSVRFISALSALGTGLLLYFLGKDIFKRRDVGIVSFFVLTSTIGFLYRARTGNLDALLGFFIMLAIFSFFKGLKRPHWLIVMGIAIGCGFLTKGMIAFLFPLVVIAYLVLSKQFNVVKSSWFLFGMLLAIVIPMMWFLISYFVNGSNFISEFSFYQTRKFATTVSIWQNFSFDFLGNLKSGFKLWFLILIPSFFYVFYKWHKTSYSIIMYYFVLFSLLLAFSENKSNWFVVPLYPIGAFFIGYTVSSLAKKFIKKAYITFFLIGLLAGYLTIIYREQYIVPDIASAEASVAKAAKKMMRPEDILYLTNYYYPNIVYYSEHQVFAVYSEQTKNTSWWIKPKEEWRTILKKANTYIVTTKQEFKELKETYASYKFEVLYVSGEKMLIKRV